MLETLNMQKGAAREAAPGLALAGSPHCPVAGGSAGGCGVSPGARTGWQELRLQQQDGGEGRTQKQGLCYRDGTTAGAEGGGEKPRALPTSHLPCSHQALTSTEASWKPGGVESVVCRE